MRQTSIAENLQQFLSQGSRKEILKEFLPLLAVVVVTITCCFFYFTYNNFRDSVKEREQEENKYLELMRFSMVRDLEILASDLHILLNSDSLQKFINKNNPSSLSFLEQRLSIFAENRKIYDQIRFIDNQGQEVVRINRNKGLSEIVAQSKLQNKKNRYYFLNAIGLGRGELYLSPLDLNVEKGQIENPLKPMLRLAAPVFGTEGEVEGIIVLNYRAGLMLDRFESIRPEKNSTDYSLINSRGDWLRTKEDYKEWGFMLKHEYSFRKENPDVWQNIKEHERGRILSSNGLYVSLVIDPLREIGKGAGATTFQEEAEKWFLLALIPSQQLSYFTYIAGYKNILALLFGCFLLMVIGAYQVSRARVVRKKATESFRLLSRGLDQSPAAVLITDKEGTIIYVNPKFERMSGYSSDEVVGENPRFFKSGTTPDMVYDDLWETIKRGDTWEGEFENKNREGDPYYVAAQISPIIGMSGRIENFIAIQEDVTERIKLQRKLEKIATTDSLTSAVSRGHFMATCDKEAKRLFRYKYPLSLLLLDIDHFKEVNDNYGHQAGDKALIDFVKIVENELRQSDTFGRLGGEEFAALLVETDRDGAQRLAERLRKAVERNKIVYEDDCISITVSIGCTEYHYSDPHISAVLKRADKALYRAKEMGRNRVEVG